MSHEPRAALVKAPKGVAWLVVYRLPDELASWVLVENYRHGLTAYEAWREASVPVSFSDAQLVQLDPYPLALSVDTKKGRNGKPRIRR